MKLILLIMISLNFNQLIPANPNRNLFIIDNEDSVLTVEKIWERNLDNETTTDILLSDNKLFISFSGGLVNCFDLNGNEKWSAELIGNIHNNSVHYKDLFLSATDEGDLYSINANNGEILQVLGIGDAITSSLSLIDLPNQGYTSKGVVFGTSSGNIFCYDIFSFELIWQRTISKNKIVSTPLIINDKIIFIDSHHSLYCVNTKSGVLIWNYLFSERIDSTLTGIPIHIQNKIISLTPRKEIIAIDQLSGKKIWNTKSLLIRTSNALNLFNDEIFFIDEKNNMIFISAKDGKEVSKTGIKDKAIINYLYDQNDQISIIVFSDNSIFRITREKKLENILNMDDQISSIKVLSGNNFIIKTFNGKIIFYKISD